MIELNPLQARLADVRERTQAIKTYLEYDSKRERLEEVTAELELPDAWNDQEKAQKLGKEKSSLENVVGSVDFLEKAAEEVDMYFAMFAEENDESCLEEAAGELERMEKSLASLEFSRMFSGPNDRCDCYMDIQSRSEERRVGYPVGIRRHRGPGLGRDGDAHVSEVGRLPRLCP